MLDSLESTLQKTCLIGLTYFDKSGEQLKQSMLAGKVKSVDKELGITIELFGDNSAKNKPAATFLIPSNLSCWFTAPAGDFHTSQAGVKITNPDYLVTWDIYQTKEQKTDDAKADGEQQWWEWQPRTVAPQIG